MIHAQDLGPLIVVRPNERRSHCRGLTKTLRRRVIVTPDGDLRSKRVCAFLVFSGSKRSSKEGIRGIKVTVLEGKRSHHKENSAIRIILASRFEEALAGFAPSPSLLIDQRLLNEFVRRNARKLFRYGFLKRLSLMRPVKVKPARDSCSEIEDGAEKE